MLKECNETLFQKTILHLITKNLPGEANLKWAAYQREIGHPKQGSFNDLVCCMQRLQYEILPQGQGQGTRSRSPSPKNARLLDHQPKSYEYNRPPRAYRPDTSCDAQKTRQRTQGNPEVTPTPVRGHCHKRPRRRTVFAKAPPLHGYYRAALRRRLQDRTHLCRMPSVQERNTTGPICDSQQTSAML